MSNISIENDVVLRLIVEELKNKYHFTSKDFTSELQKKNIRISMDHKGRCFDNILVERLWRTLKQEAIFYYRPETVIDLEKCLEKFVIWYNNERLHQSLNYVTPYSVYYA